jgi:hypothetical protein
MSLLAELVKAGLDPKKDAKIVNMPAYDQPIAYNSGSIDTFLTFEPWAEFGEEIRREDPALPLRQPLGTIDSGIESTRNSSPPTPPYEGRDQGPHPGGALVPRQSGRDHQDRCEAYKVPEEVMRASMANVALSYDVRLDNMKALAKFSRPSDTSIASPSGTSS